MIARMWQGKVLSAKAAANREFVTGRAIPDYRSVPGILSAHILGQADGETTPFVNLTFWENMDAVRGFTGENVDAATCYPEDMDLLLEFEAHVMHCEVVGMAP